jgi:hypothetical protein
VAFAGCAAKPAAITTLSEVVDEAGDDRVQLRYLEWPPNAQGETGYDFHALVWEVRYGETWTEQFAISKADFEGGTEGRWPKEVHSFDPTTGHAILKVAENKPTGRPGAYRVEYSWREWDVAKNEQVRLIRVCDPFESFDGKAPQ